MSSEESLVMSPRHLKKVFKPELSKNRNNTAVTGSSSSNVPARSVTESHLRLLKQEKHCDVTFIVGTSEDRIQCHQLFLKARSSVFETMFSERWNEGNGEIKIPDVEPKTFRAFLEFLYADTFAATVSEALNLLYVAHKYEVELLVQKCDQLLESDVKLQDSVAVFQAARKYDRPELMKKAGDLMAMSLDTLGNAWSLTEMEKETLMYLLKRDDLNMSEAEIFKMAVKWGKNQVKLGISNALNEVLADVMPLIRFPVMTLNEFTAAVVPTGVLPPDTLVQIFTYFGSDTETRKKLERSLKFSLNPRGAPARGLISFWGGSSLGQEVSTNTTVILEHKIGFTVRLIGHGESVVRSFSGMDLEQELLLLEYSACSMKFPAISAIILRCPVRENETRGHEYDENYQNGFALSVKETETDLGSRNAFHRRIELAWGQEMEVKVEPPVVLRDGLNLQIMLQQVLTIPPGLLRMYRSRGRTTYRYQACSPLKSDADVQLGLYTVRLEQLTSCHPTSGTETINLIRGIRLVEQ